MSRWTRLLIGVAVGVLCACDSRQQSPSPTEVVDETSINDVWHKATLPQVRRSVATTRTKMRKRITMNLPAIATALLIAAFMTGRASRSKIAHYRG